MQAIWCSISIHPVIQHHIPVDFQLRQHLKFHSMEHGDTVRSEGLMVVRGRVLASKMWSHAIWYMCTDISEEWSKSVKSSETKYTYTTGGSFTSQMSDAFTVNPVTANHMETSDAWIGRLLIKLNRTYNRDICLKGKKYNELKIKYFANINYMHSVIRSQVLVTLYHVGHTCIIGPTDSLVGKWYLKKRCKIEHQHVILGTKQC
jgi:hypothetical protein